MYLINGISDSENKVRFENRLHTYCDFKSIPISLLENTLFNVAQAFITDGDFSFRVSSKVIVIGKSSPVSLRRLKLENTIWVLYADSDYMRFNRKNVEKDLKDKNWIFIDSETNDGFDILAEKLK